MNSNDILKYVASMLNINTDENPLVVEDIIEELTKLQNLEGFRKFMKNNLNNKEYEFKTGFQKFIIMINDFKKLENKESENQIEEYCKKLVSKCNAISSIAYENKPKGCSYDTFVEKATFSVFRQGNGLAFNTKEIELLEKVGGCKRWLVDYDDNKFLQDLIKGVYELRKDNVLRLTKNEDKIMLEKLKG